MTPYFDEFGILDRTDMKILQNQNEPALSSAIGSAPFIESFNEWQCFNPIEFELNCLEEEQMQPPEEISSELREGARYYTTLKFEYKNLDYYFRYPAFKLNYCKEVKEEWAEILKEQREFCIFAAKDVFVENKDNEPYSFWTAYGLKTHHSRFIAPLYDTDEDKGKWKKNVLYEKYPYARLTQDYGILTEKDLERVESYGEPELLEEPAKNYLYWQYFPDWKFRYWCKESWEDSETEMHDLIVAVDSDETPDEYSKKKMTLEQCQAARNKINTVIQKSGHRVCISGKYFGTEIRKWDKEQPSQKNWIFDKIKTKTGLEFE